MSSSPLHLVTGATGFSGAYVVRELLAKGDRVLGTDLPSMLANQDNRRALSAIGLDFDHPNLTLIPSNLLEPSTLQPLFEEPLKYIFHTASLYDYSASYEALHRVNVDGTRNLLDLALQHPPQRFIHWSTCGVFGKPFTAADGPHTNLPFSESCSSPKNTPADATGPEGTYLVNDYSTSKWVQEKMVWQAHRDQGLPVTVVRPAPIYGPGSSYGHGGIILAIALGLLPAIPSDARNFITTSVHVEDVARFALFAADREELIGEDFNVVDNSIISYHEFLHYIALLTGRRLRDIPFLPIRALYPVMARAAHAWTFLQRRFGVPRVRVFEIQSAEYVSSSYWLSNRKTLSVGFQYNYPDVREGLKDTVAWFRQMGWLTDPSKTFISHQGSGKSFAHSDE